MKKKKSHFPWTCQYFPCIDGAVRNRHVSGTELGRQGKRGFWEFQMILSQEVRTRMTTITNLIMKIRQI